MPSMGSLMFLAIYQIIRVRIINPIIPTIRAVISISCDFSLITLYGTMIPTDHGVSTSSI
jgi:hypothetical protein